MDGSRLIFEEQARCEHQWRINQEVSTVYIKCQFCKSQTSKRFRLHCTNCLLTACSSCANYYLKVEILVSPPAPRAYDDKELAAKTGRMFINEELSSKFYRKMPPLIGNHLEQKFLAKFPGNSIRVLPRIHHAYQELTKMCKQASLQRSLKDLQFCSQIPILGYYQSKLFCEF